jgi:hypothetical protein
MYLAKIWNEKVFHENDCLLLHEFFKTTYLSLPWCAEILNGQKKDRMNERRERDRKPELS